MRNWRRCLYISLLSVVLVCSGCGNSANPASDTLPEPPDIAITWEGGGAAALRSTPTVIYTVEETGNRLMPSSVSVTTLPSETFAEALVKAYIEEQWKSGNAPLILSVEESREVITVNLVGSLGVDAREVFSKAQAMAKTLTGIAGINYVNILQGGAAIAFEGLPHGALSSPSNDAAGEYYLMAGTMFTRKEEKQLSAYNVTLYFPTTQGGWLMPETRRVDMSPPEDAAQDASSFLAPIIMELLQGPRSPAGFTAVTPQSALVTGVTMDTFGDGTRVVRVELTGEAMRHVTRGIITEKQLAGAIVLTITTFMPNVSAVSIEIDGRQMQTLDAEYMPSGWMQRRHFEGLIAKPLKLYFPDRNSGRLVKIERPVSALRAITPLQCARELFAGIGGSQEGSAVDNALPHLVAEDILGAIILDDTLYINLSPAGKSAMKAIDDNDAPLCVYAVINTLVDFAQVKRVQLLVNGLRDDAVVNKVFTGAPLMKRSGME